jgi:hypothetical protein
MPVLPVPQQPRFFQGSEVLDLSQHSGVRTMCDLRARDGPSSRNPFTTGCRAGVTVESISKTSFMDMPRTRGSIVNALARIDACATTTAVRNMTENRGDVGDDFLRDLHLAVCQQRRYPEEQAGDAVSNHAITTHRDHDLRRMLLREPPPSIQARVPGCQPRLTSTVRAPRDGSRRVRISCYVMEKAVNRSRATASEADRRPPAYRNRTRECSSSSSQSSCVRRARSRPAAARLTAPAKRRSCAAAYAA